MGNTSSLRPGMVLEPGDTLRPRPVPGSYMHARQAHSGAPWHPDYRADTEKKDSKRIAKGDKSLPFHDRSYFDSIELILEAIGRSNERPALVAENLNLLIFVDFGYEIGFDTQTGHRTTMATVVLEPTGKVATVHPGRPKFDSIPLPRVGRELTRHRSP